LLRRSAGLIIYVEETDRPIWPALDHRSNRLKEARSKAFAKGATVASGYQTRGDSHRSERCGRLGAPAASYLGGSGFMARY
jgi:hypothetical protein